MPAPVIDPLPSAPSRGSESREQFVLTTDAFLGSLGGFVTQVNSFGEYLNDFEAGTVSWGLIAGTLADQTDLQSALDGKLDSSVTKAELDTAVSDGNVCFDGDAVTNLTMTSARFLARTTGGGGVVEELTYSQVKTALNLEVGTDIQAWSANLDEYAAVNPSAAGLALLDDADPAAQRTTLGLVIGTDVQAYSAVLANTTASFTSADETKLDGIEAGADVTDETNVVAALSGATLSDVGTPASGDKILLLDASDSDNLKYAAFSEFGGSGSVAIADITDWPVGLDATELGYVNGVTSAIQTQLDAKAPSTAPTFATSITGSFLTASRLLGSDGSKNIVSLDTATYPSLAELAYVKGVTSAIQTQIDAKLASSSYTAADVLSKLLTVDGAGSGLDADLLDGNSSAAFALSGHSHSAFANVSGTKAELDSAVTDGNVCFDGDAATNLTMATDRLLGRTTASTGAVEEITAGVGLTLASGALDLDGWVLLDSDTGVSAVNEVAYTGIPSWVKDLRLVATGISISEGNTLQVLLYDGTSWSSTANFGGSGVLTSGSDRVAVIAVDGRHLDRSILFAAGGNGPGSSPAASTLQGTTPIAWRVDGGIDGISIKVGTGDFDAGNFYLYGRA